MRSRCSCAILKCLQILIDKSRYLVLRANFTSNPNAVHFVQVPQQVAPRRDSLRTVTGIAAKAPLTRMPPHLQDPGTRSIEALVAQMALQLPKRIDQQGRRSCLELKSE